MAWLPEMYSISTTVQDFKKVQVLMSSLNTAHTHGFRQAAPMSRDWCELVRRQHTFSVRNCL